MSANSIDLRSMPRDASGRLMSPSGAGYATVRDRFDNVTLRPIPVFTRDIREAIWAYVADNPQGVTVGQIAKAVSRKKSPWLREKLATMVRDGHLYFVEVDYRPNMPAHLYFLRG